MMINADVTHALDRIATELKRIADALSAGVPDKPLGQSAKPCECGTWRTAGMPHGDGCPAAGQPDPPADVLCTCGQERLSRFGQHSLTCPYAHQAVSALADRLPGCPCPSPDVAGHIMFACPHASG